MSLRDAVSSYVAETRRLDALPTSTETTFYPEIKALLTAVLRAHALPFEVRTGTSEGAGARRRDMPDFVLGDAGLFVGVYGEVKRADTALEDLAASVDQNDQMGRYLAQAGAVLLCNVRGFGLLLCEPGYARDPAVPVPPAQRRLDRTVDLWSGGGAPRGAVDPAAVVALADIVARAVTDHARIADPADLAKILARQARDAKDALPDDLRPVKPLLEDYRRALGLAFDVDEERGARFFRSSLVQSVFYALFAAWVLWDREADAAETFEIDDAHRHLPIPFLDALLHDIRHPSRMRHLGLEPHLARAIATLNRVDRPLFRARMTFPTVDGEDTAVAAITYFYEPFLAAFDPRLREDLGVWYTPPQIVRYQVRRVHHLLKAELGRARGLADPEVVVLDPCCGTGAYLLEVARCIAEELRAEGDEATLALELSRAFRERVIGFEVLAAPFAIAQLQLHVLLAELMRVAPGARVEPGDRLAIYLTNALSGWREPGDVKLNFPEMREEFDASQHVKREARIIVVVGNPPYDRFAGVALAEEAELVAHYKGVRLVEARTKDGAVKRDEFGRPVKKAAGPSRLYEEFGIKKQLLDDLYVRFLRLAEERIGAAADYGVVSYITNSSFLTGRSHPLMRRSLLSSFHAVWIDNLNGDKYRTGKLIPRGLPGAGTRDDSAFTTASNPRGIQPGTAITTWVKHRGARSDPAATKVLYREFWGAAEGKRQALVSSLPTGRGGGAQTYVPLAPEPGNRWRLSPRTVEGGFEAWPALDELFPISFQGVNHNRGLEGGIIDADADALAERLRRYFGASSFTAAKRACPEIAGKYAGYDPKDTWTEMRKAGHFRAEAIRPFLVFPFDRRWIYYDSEHKWLNRPRPEVARNVEGNEWLITVPEPRKASETLPVYGSGLVNLHVHERGSVLFPRETRGEGMYAGQWDANLSEPVWRVLRAHFGLSGERNGDDARALVGRLFRVALATLHAPAYQAEHRSALSADWAHLPIPKDRRLFRRLAAAGERVARLLDAGREAQDVVEKVLGSERARALGALRRMDGGQIRPGDLAVTITYWGGGKGGWRPRVFGEGEEPAAAWAGAWGDRTGDLFINDQAFFAHVPEAVWAYQLGGYPVLKKWLGYRQADRRGGAPLRDAERRWFRQVVQRVAALLALGPKLDGLYQTAIENAFTASELGIPR